MIKVNICGIEQVYDSSLASWINEQYHNRKRAGAEFWFIIAVEVNGVTLGLPSDGAPRGRGAPYSHFNCREKQIIDMWDEMDVKKDNNVSILLKFLNQLKRIVT